MPIANDCKYQQLMQDPIETPSLEPPDSYRTLVRVWNIMVITLHGFFKLQ